MAISRAPLPSTHSTSMAHRSRRKRKVSGFLLPPPPPLGGLPSAVRHPFVSLHGVAVRPPPPAMHLPFPQKRRRRKKRTPADAASVQNQQAHVLVPPSMSKAMPTWKSRKGMLHWQKRCGPCSGCPPRQSTTTRTNRNPPDDHSSSCVTPLWRLSCEVTGKGNTTDPPSRAGLPAAIDCPREARRCLVVAGLPTMR